jgi:hypothetical protein
MASANPGQANNNLLSFPYGDHFKKRKRPREKPIKLRLSEARAPEKSAYRLNFELRRSDFMVGELNPRPVPCPGFDPVRESGL